MAVALLSELAAHRARLHEKALKTLQTRDFFNPGCNAAWHLM
jgi:hypothetical protein